jgi:alpha-1,6-mannosyltransferase
MAANILAVWQSDRAAMADQARDQALQFSWDSSMEALFGRVYPAAFAKRMARQVPAPAAPALAA